MLLLCVICLTASCLSLIIDKQSYFRVAVFAQQITGNKKAPALWCFMFNRFGYCFLNRRDAKPIIPNAKMARVEGSGTETL